MKTIISNILLLSCTFSMAELVITEAMSSSSHTNVSINGDWWELTNTGSTAVNLAGYKWCDAINDPALAHVFPSVTIAAGESIVILDEIGANIPAWRSAWGLSASAQVIAKDSFASNAFFGFSSTNGDSVILFDSANTEIDSISFVAATPGRSFAWHPNGRPVYGNISQTGRNNAYSSTNNDQASPTNSLLRFTSSPNTSATSSYSYTLTTANPTATPATLTATTIPSFLTLSASSGGNATLTVNRALSAADAGQHLVHISATNGVSTNSQYFLLNVFHSPSPIVLNEYNAVSAANFLNGGTLAADSSGGAASDSFFGRKLGNGGAWVEFVVTGNDTVSTVDMRGWIIEVGKNTSTGFVRSTTIMLNQHSSWSNVPTGSILTFTEKNTAQGGRDSGFLIRDRRSTLGDSWSNVFLGDTVYLNYINQATNGYSLISGVVSLTNIDSNGTQFRVKNASGHIVSGSTGEGVAPSSGISSSEIFELEGEPRSTVIGSANASASTEGYDDSANESTFGLPNRWVQDSITKTQSFAPFATTNYLSWIASYGLTGANAQPAADPDGDFFTNEQEFVNSTNPTISDFVGEPFLTIDQPNKNLSASAQNYPVAILSNRSWVITENSDWITVNPLSGSDNANLTITTAANNSIYSRTAIVDISGVTHTVTQRGKLETPGTPASAIGATPATFAATMLGTYTGILVKNDNQVEAHIPSIKIAATGAYSGSVFINGISHSFKGNFLTTPNPSQSLIKTGQPTRSLTLALANTTAGNPIIQASLTGEDVASTGTAIRAALQPTMAGKWTALIPTSEAAPNEPQGLGSLSFSVTATKTTISIKGTLGDGTKVTGTQYMSADGEMPAFFKANVKGHLAGWIRLRDVAATSDLDGSVHWKKPLVTSGYYRAGFNIFRTLIASRHNPIGRSLTLTEPATLPAPNAIVQIYDIESSTVIEEPIYWSPVNRITKINLPALLSLKTTASTGAVTGTFTKSNKFKLTLNGTVYQKQNIASGTVINATKQTTGWFMIIPN